MRRRPLGPQDAAWVHLDRPDNPMAITGVLTLAGPLAPERLRALLEERLLARWPPFRRRVTATALGRLAWEDDPDLDLDLRVRVDALAPGETLAGRVAQLGRLPLDPRVAPWDVALFTQADGRAALVGRFHHCLADGMALTRVVGSLLDGEPEAPGPRERVGRRRAAVPYEPGRIARALRLPAHAARELERLLTLPADPPTPLRRPLDGEKRVAFCDPIPLAPIREAGRRRGATINDVLLAMLAGALREVLGDALAGIETLRAIVPVDARRGGPIPPDLGNRLGMVLAPLPVGEPDADRRIDAVHRETTRLKDSLEPGLVAGLLDLFGHVPAAVQRVAAEVMAARASLLVTNVPGPRVRRTIAGVPVERVLVWVPQVASIRLGVAFFSYAGELHVGVAADTGVLPDPAPLARAISAAGTRSA